MISAVFSVALGVTAFAISIPMLVPVIGIALGANGLIKEQKKESDEQNKSVKVLSILGLLLCATVLILSFVARSSQ